MATTADYLNKLIEQKNTLADNLVTKGVTATHEETLETLVPKVLDITSGNNESVYPIGEDGSPSGDVFVPLNVINLSDRLFKSNNNVQNIVFSEGLLSIKNSGCSGMSNLETIYLPSSFKTFEASSFYDCRKLTTINNMENLSGLSIGNSAFYQCFQLSNDTINELIEKSNTIGDSAFYRCTSLTEVITPNAGNGCFNSCTGLKKATVTSTNTSGGFGAYLFANCTSLEEVILPSEYTSIPNQMFYKTKISNFIIPASCTSIGQNAFAYTPLTTLSIDENASFSLGNGAFQYCNSLTGEIVQSLIEHASSLDRSVFTNCNSLVNITVKFASFECFRQCENLVYAKILQPLNGIICGSMFVYCTKLETCILPEGATIIENAVCGNCTSLKTVYLPSSLTSDKNNYLKTYNGAHVLYNCTALEDVQVGKDWNMSLYLAMSNNLTIDSMVAMFNNLKDLTGETAKTLTLGTTNLAKLSDEQKAIATNKNWTLA